MKPMDFNRFKRWIARSGYSVGRSKKHHIILDAEGKKAKRVAKGRNCSKGSVKRKIRRITLPDDVAMWLKEPPARIEEVRAPMTN